MSKYSHSKYELIINKNLCCNAIGRIEIRKMVRKI